MHFSVNVLSVIAYIIIYAEQRKDRIMKYNKILTHLILLGFLLGVHNGKVALWKEPDPEPIRIFPCPISTLPAEVRQALEQGIRFESDTDLERLLENFSS